MSGVLKKKKRAVGEGRSLDLDHTKRVGVDKSFLRRGRKIPFDNH